MADKVKVICNECKKAYFVADSDAPEDAEIGEAFSSGCPYCGSLYAILVEYIKDIVGGVTGARPMQQEQVRIICLTCEKIYYVPDYLLDDAEEETLFEECPYCNALVAEIVD